MDVYNTMETEEESSSKLLLHIKAVGGNHQEGLLQFLQNCKVCGDLRLLDARARLQK